MSNKANNLKFQKHAALQNNDKAFRQKAQKVEKLYPIGYTSGLGSDNYYFNEGRAYDSYKEAINDVAKRKDIK